MSDDIFFFIPNGLETFQDVSSATSTPSASSLQNEMLKIEVRIDG